MVNLRKRNADIVQFVSIFGILSPTDICGLEGCIGGCDDVLKDFTERNRFGSHNQTTTPDSKRCNSKRCKAGQFTNENKRCKAGGFKAGQFTKEHTPVVNSQGFRSTHPKLNKCFRCRSSAVHYTRRTLHITNC